MNPTKQSAPAKIGAAVIALTTASQAAASSIDTNNLTNIAGSPVNVFTTYS